jgi:hypothetical protein
VFSCIVGQGVNARGRYLQQGEGNRRGGLQFMISSSETRGLGNVGVRISSPSS